MTRADAVQALREALAHQLSTLSTMTGAAREEATSAESRPENKYDTRALEASYLAAGQGQRLAELRSLHDWLMTLGDTPTANVRLGTLAELEDGDATRWVLLAPRGGPGAKVDGEGVVLLGAASPLGRVLIGLEPGDGAAVKSPKGLRDVEVVTIR